MDVPNVNYFCAVTMIIFVHHGLLARDVKAFAADRRPHGERWYRVFNEAPTLIFIGIVILVVFKPF